MPSRPQVEASDFAQSVALRGALPAGTVRQMPGDEASEQVRQVPVQALSQQTPSTQKPLLHWPSHEQAKPRSLFLTLSSVHMTRMSAASSASGASVLLASAGFTSGPPSPFAFGVE